LVSSTARSEGGQWPSCLNRVVSIAGVVMMLLRLCCSECLAAGCAIIMNGIGLREERR